MKNVEIDRAAALLTPALGAAAEVPAPPGVEAQLQTMNDADCSASKRADNAQLISTLAPEYVTIEATGARTTFKDMVAQENQPSQTKVRACGTMVSSVTRDGERYYLYGVYTEEGIVLKGQRHYRTVERIRDSWRRIGSQWKQAQSLSYEYTAWIDGKQVAHHVLSEKAIQEAG